MRINVRITWPLDSAGAEILMTCGYLLKHIFV
jgi:hypothetical protein